MCTIEIDDRGWWWVQTQHNATASAAARQYFSPSLVGLILQLPQPTPTDTYKGHNDGQKQRAIGVLFIANIAILLCHQCDGKLYVTFDHHRYHQKVGGKETMSKVRCVGLFSQSPPTTSAIYQCNHVIAITTMLSEHIVNLDHFYSQRSYSTICWTAVRCSNPTSAITIRELPSSLHLQPPPSLCSALLL